MRRLGHALGTAVRAYHASGLRAKAQTRPRRSHAAMAADPIKTYLEKSSPRFQRTFHALEQIVKKRFPDAERAFGYKMPGWRILVKGRVPPEMQGGTIDARFVHIHLVERKHGITFHLWNPVDYGGLERAAPALQEAGFKVMAGCVQFNRKADFPIEAVERVLARLKR